MIPLIVWLSIVINEVFPAPRQGNEWVELYNASAETIDISGWVIDDDTPGGTRVVFGPNTTLAPHTWLVVSMPSAIFNNTGDTVTLSDASGSIIDSMPYTAIDNDLSIARVPDGAASIVLTSQASAGASNATLAPSDTATPVTIATTVVSDTTIFTTATATITVVHTADQTPTITMTHTATSTETSTPTLSPSKTPSATKTLSPSKTPSATKTLSPSKTPSATKTPTTAKIASATKTPSATKTLSPTKTASATKTLSPSKTAGVHAERARSVPPTTTPTTQPWLAVRMHEQTPLVVVCHPQGHSLAGWDLVVDGEMTHIVEEGECYTADIPQTAHLALQNSHQFPVATLAADAAFCAIDIGACRPSQRPNTPVLVLEASPTARATVRVPATHTPAVTIVSAADTPAPPAPPTRGLLWIGGLCVAGGVALRMLATPRTDVLYSHADSDAASTDATVAQRVEDSESSTDDHHEGHR